MFVALGKQFNHEGTLGWGIEKFNVECIPLLRTAKLGCTERSSGSLDRNNNCYLTRVNATV